ncbi:MAG: diguanylate cyclase [Pyrinomonadaceae bacterium]
MRYVVLLSGEFASPAPALLDALREAGIAAAPRSEAGALTASPEANGSAPPPLAVLYEVGAGADVAAMHGDLNRAIAAWPGAPLIACRRDPMEERDRRARRLVDDATLKRLGFGTVADEPAQLPGLLRALAAERRAAGQIHARPGEGESALSSAASLLPKKLGGQALRAAFEMVAALHFAADQKSAASTALAGLASLVHADQWTIYLAGNAGGRADAAMLEPLAVHGTTPGGSVLAESDWRRALVGDALALAGVESRAARLAFTGVETICRKEGARRIVAVPLVCGDRVIGVLEVVRESDGARSFTTSDTALLSALALPLSAALSNAVRIAEAERLSLTDDLTKLHNARFLRQYLTSEIKRARRYNSTVTVLFLDLDDFKRVNDQHGHLVGSHVLVEMAAVILECVRDTDVVARYGGDEFVVILPETGWEQAASVADRVRESIANYVFNGGRNLSLLLTASFGIAAFPQHAQSPQQLIACADSAMYEAKAARKNCIRFASSPPADT